MTDVGLSDSKILTMPNKFYLYVTEAVLNYLDFTPYNPTDHNKAIEAYLTSLGVTLENFTVQGESIPCS